MVVALSLKDRETDRLARELASRTGESLTMAIRHALRDKLAELRARDETEREARFKALMEIADHCAALPILDDRTENQILGWDENGLPT